MKFSINLFLALFTIAVLGSACGQKSKNEAGSEGYDLPVSQSSLITPDELADRSDPYVLIDVRTPEEYESGHLADAVLINIRDDDFEKKLEGLDKKAPVVVYCKKGGRSAKAAKIMEDMGFEEIYDLEGGVTNWQSQGFDLIKD